MSLRTSFSIGMAASALALLVGCATAGVFTPTGGPPATGTTIPAATERVTATAPAAELPWWKDRVFYEVFVRSFYDSTGDGVGDLQGLIRKLDYLNDGNAATNSDLGVTGLWLMPIMESPSYHGYDVTDYRKVQPAYGTNDDFKQLMQEAHRRGMVVIVDLPLNHTSDLHPWFIDAQQRGSKHENWYVWSESDPGYLGPWNEPVWHPLGGRYYYGIFDAGMPDLNYRNPEVTAEMDDITRFWLEDMGADGVRLDAARHLIEDGRVQQSTPETRAWLKDYHRMVKSVNQNALVVGEVWADSGTAASYVGDQLDLTFEFELASAFIAALQRGNADGLRVTQQKVLNLYPQGQYAAFLSNHDQNRVMAQLLGDPQAARVAASLLLTNPGVPFIYYGEEIGMTEEKPDEAIRTPMVWDSTPGTGGFTTAVPWEPLAPGSNMANVATEMSDPGSLLAYYQTLIRLRQAHSALRRGAMALVDSTSSAVYSTIHFDAQETVLVVANLSEKPVRDYSLSLSQGPLEGKIRASLLMGGGAINSPTLNANGGFDGYAPLPELPPLTSLIIRLAP